MAICKICGREINQDEEFAHVVNPGLETEYVECQTCHEEELESHKIIQCEACGEWFTTSELHSDEEEVGGDTFCACPSCGNDIVDGMTREERTQQNEELYIPKFSVVIYFHTGGSRGYVVSANNENEAINKLFQYLNDVNMACISSFHISGILLDEDIIS